MIISKCEGRRYGNICNVSCGRCKNGDGCDKLNGTCFHGCERNHQQSKCKGIFFLKRNSISVYVST